MKTHGSQDWQKVVDADQHWAARGLLPRLPELRTIFGVFNSLATRMTRKSEVRDRGTF